MKHKELITVVITYVLIVSSLIVTASLVSEVTTVVAQLTPIERNHTIVIDAGHGGPDGGAISCTGVMESKFNLDISLRLNDLLQLLGHKTVMIRTEDESIYISGETIAAKKISDLRQRVKLANEIQGGVLVSIHQNTFSDSRYSGPQVFYGTKGEGEQLAKILQKSLTEVLSPGSNRMAKKADGIYLMQHINCTGVLIECGFLSNPEEEAKLRNCQYQQKLCCVIGTSLVNFLDG